LSNIPHDQKYLHPVSIDLFGFNRKSKYVARGMGNHKLYDRCLKLLRDVDPGEMGICRDGYGTLVSQQSNVGGMCLEP
jgi:hypothetical protein